MTLQTKTDLDTTIDTNLADNTTALITPALHRAVEKNIADGIWELVSTPIDDTDSPFSVVLDTTQVLLADSTSGNITVNLPAVASNANKRLYVKNIGTGNTVTLDGNASEEIDLATTKALTTLQSVLIHCDGSDWWILADA